jgi:hypothetical protein
MANLNAPTGFTPVRNAGGGTTRTNRYYIAGGLASNIYRGSAVIATNTSKQINVAAAGATTLQIGVFKGCFYLDAGGNTQFRPYWGSGQTIATGSIVEAEVFDDPLTMFAIQVSGVAGLVAANVGLLANYVIGVGSTFTGNSADQLDQTTIGTGASLRIEELQQANSPQQPGSLNNFGQFAKALVRFAVHNLGATLTAA